MSQLNVNGVGTLTADPVLKTVGSKGAQVCNFTLAFNRSFKKEGIDEWQTEACFMRCELWGTKAVQLAEAANKGQELYVMGSLSQQNWITDKEEKRTAFQIRVVDFRLCQKLNKSNGESGQPVGAGVSSNAPTSDNDIPF